MDALVTMTGRVGTSVDLRATKYGFPYARFRMAHTPRVQRDGEWADGETTWVSVRCYKALAENIAYSLRKGDPVLVTGRLRTESWVDSSEVSRDSLVLEAISLGHDLALGQAYYRKPERRPQPESDQAPEDTEQGAVESGEERVLEAVGD